MFLSPHALGCQSTSDIALPHSVYSSIPLLHKSLTRLLKLLPPEHGSIRCQMDVVDLVSKPDYRTLSYTWGAPTPDASKAGITDARVCSILCNDKELGITENLYHFLRHASARLEEYGGYIWIDVICINQDDNTEKTSEVIKMADIYRSAKSVIVWLGESDEFSREAIELIYVIARLPQETLQELNPGNMAKPEMVALKLGSPITPHHWTSLRHFFQRTWFTRVWIIQEVVLSNDIKVHCGTQILNWEDLTSISLYFKRSVWRPYFTNPDPRVSDDIFAGASPAVLSLLKQNLENSNVSRLDLILSRARGYRAREKNDHVYALLSMASDHFLHPQNGSPALIPDYYRHSDDTYTLVARLLMEQSNDLLLLSMVEDGSMRTTLGIPSWAPDWSVCFHGIGVQFRLFFSAAPGLSQKPRFAETTDLLLLRGAALDTVVETGPSRDESTDSWENFKKWLKIVEGLDRTYVTGQPRMEVFWRTLILNTDSPNQVHPAPASMESSFCSWIQSSAILLTTLTLGHDMNKETELAYLDELAEDLELKLQSSEMNRYEELIKSGSESELNDIFAASSPYDTAALNQNFLVLFRTEKGFLGYGPLSTQKGDQVWILPGANVPFVLRKISDKPRYRLLGDTYVHGFMYGEALLRDLEFINIAVE